MKLQLEIQLPSELARLVETLIQAASIYTEGAKAFPPADCVPSAAVAEQVPPTVTTEPTQQSDRSAEPAPMPAPKTKTAKAKAAKPAVPSPTEIRERIASAEGGLERAKQLLVSRGKQKISELNEEELVSFLADLGVSA